MKDAGVELWIMVEQGEADLTPIHVVRTTSNNWQEVEAYVGRIPQEYKLILEARPTNGLRSEAKVAVDLIFMFYCLKPFECESRPAPDNFFTCANNVCVPSESVCDFVDDCGDFSDETNCGNY